MKYIYSVIFVLLCLNFNVFCTTSIKNVDQLNEASKHSYDSNKYETALLLSRKALKLARASGYKSGELKALVTIGDIYNQQDDNKKAINTYENAIIIAKIIENDDQLAYCYKEKGICNKALSKYSHSITDFNQAIHLYKKANDLKEIAKIEYQIATIYKDQKKTEDALRLYYKSLAVIVKTEEYDFIVTLKNSIGEVLKGEKQWDQAIGYLNEAANLAKREKKDDLLADSLTLLAGTYEAKKDFKKSEKYYKKAIEILQNIKDEYRLSVVLNNLGDLYKNTKRFSLAKKFIQRALDLYEKNDFLWGISAANANLGEIAFKENRYITAMNYLIKAENIADTNMLPNLQRFIYDIKSKLYVKTGEAQAAIDYLKKYIQINDKMLNEDRNRKFAEMQTKYETERKDAAIKISKLNLNRQHLISRIFFGGFLIVLIIVSLLYSRYRLKKRANAELSQINHDLNTAKQEIEEKNLHITDSIVYSKRIQNAILPTSREMRKSLKDHFVIYRPKDIVSGDFYWLYSDENCMILAVVDCTGHGVPGALMSVMGNSLLNEIVNDRQKLQPDRVLYELNIGVVKALKKSEQESRINDGMDVCLIFQDKQANKVFFCGARRPLFLYRQKTKQLEEYKGNRISIGEFKKTGKSFHAESLDLEVGDMVYLTSDGFVDQSNVEGKKIGSRKFRSLLNEISEDSLKLQKKKLESLLDTHQAEEEQRDDITIIGFRYCDT